MRFAHLSDLHIGKRVNGFLMLEDQQYILSQIVDIIRKNNVDAVLIAGDIYDKSAPSAEAVALCDEFFTALAGLKKHIFIISGNHDCPERIAFANQIMELADIHIAPVFDGNVQRITLTDSFGEVEVYLLPFIKPVGIRRYYEDCVIEDYTDAVRTVLAHTAITETKRNVLVAHQFVTGAARAESEEITVGGLDQVEASVLEAFDYVALGHLHSPQQVGRASLRYSGSPLKYSFSEAGQQKSVTLAELGKKGTPVTIQTIPLVPLRNLRELKSNYEELTKRENYIYSNTQDYIHITLTDEEDIPDAAAKLRSIYPNLMKVDYDNIRTRTKQDFSLKEETVLQSPLELFEEFYQLQNNQTMSESQRAMISDLIDEIWHAQ